MPIRAIRKGRSSYVREEDVHRFEAAGIPVNTIPAVGHDVHVEGLEALVALLAG